MIKQIMAIGGDGFRRKPREEIIKKFFIN